GAPARARAPPARRAARAAGRGARPARDRGADRRRAGRRDGRAGGDGAQPAAPGARRAARPHRRRSRRHRADGGPAMTTAADSSCTGDRIVLARRAGAESPEWEALLAHVRVCAECRVAWLATQWFEGTAGVEPGDERLVGRAVEAALA